MKKIVFSVVATALLGLAATAQAATMIVDDFESYADSAELALAWPDSSSAPVQTLDSGTMLLAYDVDDLTEDSVVFEFSEIQDFSLMQTFVVEIFEAGVNSVDDLLFELRDSDNNLLGSETLAGGTTPTSGRWVVQLNTFANLNLARRIVLGVVDNGGDGGTGTVGFDNVQISAGTYSSCVGCHGDFRRDDYTTPGTVAPDWGDLHDLHRITMLDFDCNTCHGPGDRFPVSLDSSVGGSGFEPISCMGCHGRNVDAGNDDGVSAGRGAGLRQYHYKQGVTFCADCHPDGDPEDFKPAGEHVLPSYYFTPDAAHPNKPLGACDMEEFFGPDGDGLDNDGDGLNEAADFDCLCSSGAGPESPASCYGGDAGKSSFALKAKGGGKDKMSFKLGKGEAVLSSALGEPTGSSGAYKLCVWDVPAVGDPVPVVDGTINPGGDCSGKPCWKELSSGFLYKNKTGNVDGATQLLLKAGDAGKAQLKAQMAKGNYTAPALPLAGTNVVAQLYNEGDECWQIEFPAPSKNTDSGYKAKGP